jgi:hypothetical protein
LNKDSSLKRLYTVDKEHKLAGISPVCSSV